MPISIDPKIQEMQVFVNVCRLGLNAAPFGSDLRRRILIAMCSEIGIFEEEI